MFSISKVAVVPVVILYLVALSTVVLTAHVSGYEKFLRIMSTENGFFELISVALLLFITVYGIVCSMRNRERFTKVAFIAIVAFSFLAFLGAMEEISWGQQFFHFESSEFFLKENLQKETNIHNLIDATVFSGVIYFSIYTFFIFIPLLYKIFKKSLNSFPLLSYFDISAHTILIAIFSSMFQIYFYDNIGSWADMLTYFVTLILFAYYLWMFPSSLWLKVHYFFILFATMLSLWSHEVYRFKNMQYEIRESFVVLAALLIFIELIKKEKKDETSSLDNG